MLKNFVLVTSYFIYIYILHFMVHNILYPFINTPFLGFHILLHLSDRTWRLWSQSFVQEPQKVTHMTGIVKVVVPLSIWPAQGLLLV